MPPSAFHSVMVPSSLIAVQMKGGQAAAIVAQGGIAVVCVAQPANVAIQLMIIVVVLRVEYAELCFSHTVGIFECLLLSLVVLGS